MFEPNVLNYFLVLLGGFGVVWSYRKTRKQHEGKIGEFEYAAFSTLWGIPLFFIFVQMLKQRPDLMNNILALPMMGTIILFPLGAAFGYFGAQIVSLYHSKRKFLSLRDKS